MGDKVLVYCPKRKRGCYIKWQRLLSDVAEVVIRINRVTKVVQFTKSRNRQNLKVDKIKSIHRATMSAEAEGSPKNPAAVQVLYR